MTAATGLLALTAGAALAAAGCGGDPGEDERTRADVAHDPRQDVDDEPENECEAYRSGEAVHFVELDPDGELIRAE